MSTSPATATSTATATATRATPAQAPEEAPAGPVRLGVHGPSDQAWRIVAAAGHPREAVRLVPYEVGEPFAALRAGRADLVLVKYPRTLVTHPGAEPDLAVSAPVQRDGRAVLVGTHHPLADRDAVSIEELAAFDAFACPGDFPPHVWDLVTPPRTPAGRTVRRVHRMTTFPALTALLRTTHAVHVSFRSLASVLPPGVRAVPVTDLPPAPVALAWLRTTQPPPHVRWLVTEAERAWQR
ncbi:LysR substrate-binding domain-containing protein [Streptomyces sp. DSM 44915]|uniref:LysR substrate-binding domain-containing protein n=1 Tax=Streptomyces chisholmiae TaxID=3075540 RepID=A0ABU2JW68_9ACTN|nr:LysR substrate-binding domain-containing protein [Streptomyces sp. DSM 44915]MDT0269246.1 LysR substrate-binding domain-containing protein [Streptomyces sp. DSM 44915]